MAADGSDSEATQAAQACIICKTRKKKCDKSLPSRGYCTKKKLDCRYSPIRPSDKLAFVFESPNTRNIHTVHPPHATTSCPVPQIHLPVNPIKFAAIQLSQRPDEVYHEVHKLVRGTGQYIDDFTTRYFQGFHCHLPMVSRSLLHRKLTRPTSELAEISVLLLTMCLVTYAPATGYRSKQEHSTVTQQQQQLYLAAKSLLSQIQTSAPDTHPISLVQAGILIALYEYIQTRPGDAFITIAGISRLAYAAGIHRVRMEEIADGSLSTNLLSESQEASNTWWALIICERVFFGDIENQDQPLITTTPSGNTLLPVDSQVLDQLDVSDVASLPDICVSSYTLSIVGGIGRTAQAICLFDQVLKSFDIQDINLRLLQLDSINTDVQTFLSMIMASSREEPDRFCFTISITIRTLFVLHNHILSLHPGAVGAKFRPMEGWWRKSQKVLDTVTKIVVDIATALTTLSRNRDVNVLIDNAPPTYPYIASAALRYISRCQRTQDNELLESWQGVLRDSTLKYSQQWNVATQKDQHGGYPMPCLQTFRCCHYVPGRH